jgi:Flp pilus assembly pilin Flp
MPLFIRIYAWVRARGDAGQATAEYALVVVGAAAIALVLITWATTGGGADRIGHLFSKVVDAVAQHVS